MTFAPEGVDAPRFPFAKMGLLFGVLALIAVADVLHDLQNGGSPSLAIVELGAMATVLGVAFYYWSQSIRVSGHARSLVHRLDRAQADAERWRREAANVLPALGAAVQRQFDRWALNQDERRLAMLLLGGQALPEIAGRLGAGTRAVRQQALALYAKAGVSGRAELSAFFLSDLFYLVGVPTQPQPTMHRERPVEDRQDPLAAL